jgi:hypothetical protein
MSLVMMTGGCWGTATKIAGKIVLDIGTEILVEAGGNYLQKIFTADDAEDDATLIVSYINSTGDGIGANYAVAGAGRITTQNVTVHDVKGDIHIVADGNGVAVTAAGGTTGKVEIEMSGSGGPDSDAEDQAATIDGILTWSGRSRSALFRALADLEQCRDVDGATEALRGVAKGRDQQVDALENVDVSDLRNGRSIRDTLVKALKYSFQADQAFVRWGEAGCGTDDNYADGMRYSKSATATKRQFITQWNPVAAAYGLPEYEEQQI